MNKNEQMMEKSFISQFVKFKKLLQYTFRSDFVNNFLFKF